MLAFWAFHRPKWQISLPFHILQLVKSLRTLSYTCGLWKEPLWAGPSNIGRYKGYPRGLMALSQTTFSTKPLKSHDNLKVDLKVTVMLNYWNQFIKSYTEILSTISLSPMGRGEGGRLHTRYTENCEWRWYSRWSVVSPTSRYFRLRPLKSFALNVRSFRWHVISRFANDFLDFLSWLTDITITECDQNVSETA